MSLKPVTCLVAYCDDCGDSYEHDYQPHFRTEKDALFELGEAEWTVRRDGKIFCPKCEPSCNCESEACDETCSWGECLKCPRHGVGADPGTACSGVKP